MHRKRISFFLILFLFYCKSLFAQSKLVLAPLSLTLVEAEKSFLQNNFLLLAAKYGVDIANASMLQAKLYPNPNLSINQGAYNKDQMKWFDLSKRGETAVSLQQIIILAGKRNKQIHLAKINSQISIYQFYDLIRTLRFALRSSFYKLYYLRQSVDVYDKEIESLQSLVDVYTAQYHKGNIAFKELARLQALQFNLENERLDLVKSASEQQSNLTILTGDTLMHNIHPLPDTSLLGTVDVSKLNYVQLLDSGLANRSDLLKARTELEAGRANLALQKALRVPDISVGANWDRQGSYVYNYNSISLAMDIPFFNRNQGNVKMAAHEIEQSKQFQSQAELEVRTEIDKAYSQLLETEQLYKRISLQFNTDYDKLLDGITTGYRNRTISLLEFIDYYETYKNSKIEFNRLLNNRFDAMENLNFATGSTVIK